MHSEKQRPSHVSFMFAQASMLMLCFHIHSHMHNIEFIGWKHVVSIVMLDAMTTLMFFRAQQCCNQANMFHGFLTLYRSPWDISCSRKIEIC